MGEAPKLDGEVWRGLVRVHGGEDLLAVTEQDGALVVRWWHDGTQGPARWREPGNAQEAAALREALRAERARFATVRAAAATLLAADIEHGSNCPHRYCEDCNDGDVDGCEHPGEPCDCLIGDIGKLRAAAAGGVP
jgi:hypothetical protein